MELIEKHSKNLGNLTIKKISKILAKSMITLNHYSKTWNSGFGKINYGIYRDDQLVGVAVFGNMLNAKAHSHIITTGEESIIELNRLWISDELGKNAETILISSSFKLIKSNYPKIKYIQSFADGRLGCGTIYKASNFKYYGYTESLFLNDDNTDKVYHKILFENTSRPITYLYLNAQYLDNKLTFFKVKTYRYIYSLYNDYSNVLMKEEKYPPYNKGFTVTEHSQSFPSLVRCYIMYSSINSNYAKKTLDKLREMGYNGVNIDNEVVIQDENEYVNNFIRNKVVNKVKFFKRFKIQKGLF